MNATQTTEEREILNQQRWGLPSSAIEKLGEELRTIWERAGGKSAGAARQYLGRYS